MELWNEMRRRFVSFPAGVADISQPIRGSAFFPGGLGLQFVDDITPDIVKGQIMVVGQDFDTVKKYEKALACPEGEEHHPTWSRMTELFGAYKIECDRCFFTNLYMGLRKEGKATGRFVGRDDPCFVTRCLEFFEHQVRIIEPRLIIMLGRAPIEGVGGLLGIDPCDRFYKYDRLYPINMAHGKVVVVAMTHPSNHRLNIKHRRYKTTAGDELIGLDAETALMREAMQKAFRNRSVTC